MLHSLFLFDQNNCFFKSYSWKCFKKLIDHWNHSRVSFIMIAPQLFTNDRSNCANIFFCRSCWGSFTMWYETRWFSAAQEFFMPQINGIIARSHLRFKCDSRAFHDGDVIILRLYCNSKFKLHLKFLANRNCFDHPRASLVVLGGFVNKWCRFVTVTAFESQPNCAVEPLLPPW